MWAEGGEWRFPDDARRTGRWKGLPDSGARELSQLLRRQSLRRYMVECDTAVHRVNFCS